MKRLLTWLFLILTASAWAQLPPVLRNWATTNSNPLGDFNVNQFNTTGNKISLKSGVVISNPVIAGILIASNGIVTNLYVENFFPTNVFDSSYPDFWGAAADGVTDDSVAVQLAIMYTSNRVVNFRHGASYAFKHCVATNDVTFRGPATWVSIPITGVSQTFVTVTNCGNVSFEDLQMDGKGTTYGLAVATMEPLVEVRWVSNFTMLRCEIYQHAAGKLVIPTALRDRDYAAVVVRNHQSAIFDQVIIHDNWSEQLWTYVDYGVEAKTIVTKCRSYRGTNNPANTPVTITGGSQVIEDCEFLDSNGSVVNCQAPRSLKVVNSKFLRNTNDGPGLNINHGGEFGYIGKDVVIIGNTFEDNFHGGIQLSCQSAIVTGNTFRRPGWRGIFARCYDTDNVNMLAVLPGYPTNSIGETFTNFILTGNSLLDCGFAGAGEEGAIVVADDRAVPLGYDTVDIGDNQVRGNGGGCIYAVNLRAVRNTKVHHNHLFDYTTSGIYHQLSGTNVSITENFLGSDPTSAPSAGGMFFGLGGTVDGLDIKNNNFTTHAPGQYELTYHPATTFYNVIESGNSGLNFRSGAPNYGNRYQMGKFSIGKTNAQGVLDLFSNSSLDNCLVLSNGRTSPNNRNYRIAMDDLPLVPEGSMFIAPSTTLGGYTWSKPGLVIDHRSFTAIGGWPSPLAPVTITGAVTTVSSIGYSDSRPPISTNLISGEINAWDKAGFGGDAGMLRLSAGGGTTNANKTYMDLVSSNNDATIGHHIFFGTGGQDRASISDSTFSYIGYFDTPTNTPTDAFVLTATGTSGASAWKAVPSGISLQDATNAAKGVLASDPINPAHITSGSITGNMVNLGTSKWTNSTTGQWLSYDNAGSITFSNAVTGTSNFNIFAAVNINRGTLVVTNGNVGIGTASPFVSARMTIDNTTDNNTVAGNLRMRGLSARYRADWNMGSGGLLFNAYDDTGGAYLPLQLDALKTILGMQGNVSVGTTSPDGKVTVIGDIRVSTTITATNGFIPQVKANFYTNYTTAISDSVLFCTGTNQLITLLDATNTTTLAGKTFTIVAASTYGSVIVTNANGVQTIMGSLSQTVGPGSRLSTITSGLNWW